MKPLNAVQSKQNLFQYQEIFTLKTGNITLEQKPFRPENHELVALEIIKFRQWRANFENHDIITVQDMPLEFYDLFALLVHESNDTLETLATNIDKLLTPFTFKKEGSEPFKKALKEIIKVIAHHERYGLGEVILLIEDAPLAIPDRFSFYRWQAHDTTAFPLDIQQEAMKRRDARKKFSSEVTRTFQNLDHQKQLDLLRTRETRLKVLKRMDSEYFTPKSPPLFKPFKTETYTKIEPTVGFKRMPIASNFNTLLYSGLDSSIDLKQRFFSSLSQQSKVKRGQHIDVNIQKEMQDNNSEKFRLLRMKLLMFHEDVRQPYYGTCSKTSKDVTGRTPFGKDKHLLNYEEDSELEWDHDVDTDDIHDLMLSSPVAYSSSEDEMSFSDESEKRDDRWIVPDDYFTDIENNKKQFVVIRPAQRPESTQFPMKPVILGPSFESVQEHENHPLSDSKFHTIEEHPADGCTVFDLVYMNKDEDEDIQDMTSALPLATVYDKDKQKEFEKLSEEDHKQLIYTIMENRSKTLMRIMNTIRSKKILVGYSSAQLQAIIHDVAVQEVRGDSKEYVWFIKQDTKKNQ